MRDYAQQAQGWPASLRPAFSLLFCVRRQIIPGLRVLSKPVLCWGKTERRSRGGWSSGFTRVVSTLPLASRHTLMCPRLIWLHPCAAQSHLHRASASIYFRFLSPGLSALASIARSFCGRDVKSGAQRLISTLCAGFPRRLICTERRAPLHSVPSCWGVEPSFPVTRFC